MLFKIFGPKWFPSLVVVALSATACGGGKKSADATASAPAADESPFGAIQAAGDTTPPTPGASAGTTPVTPVGAVPIAMAANVDGVVKVRPSADLGLAASAEIAAVGYRVEAVKLSSGNSKVQLLAKTVTDAAGAIKVAIPNLVADDVLLVVAYKNETSVGQTLIPMKDYAALGTAKVSISVTLNTKSTVTAGVLVKLDVKLSKSLGDTKLQKISQLVDETITTLGPVVEKLTTTELVTAVLAVPTFKDSVAQILAVDVAERNACDAQSWNFIQRQSVSSVFGTDFDVATMDKSLKPVGDGVYELSPSRLLLGKFSLHGSTVATPVDNVEVTLSEDAGTVSRCYGLQGLFDQNCPNADAACIQAARRHSPVGDVGVVNRPIVAKVGRSKDGRARIASSIRSPFAGAGRVDHG